MNKQEVKKYYEEVFSDAAKAKAFDSIVKESNVRKLSSSPSYAVLAAQFNVFYEAEPNNANAYSDVVISKIWDVSLERTRQYKETIWARKLGPKGDWWKAPFLKLAESAEYAHGRIKLHVPERILYCTLLSQISREEKAPKTSDLLQIAPAEFVKLHLAAQGTADKKKSIKECIKVLKDNREISKKFAKKLTPSTWIEVLPQIFELAKDVVGLMLEIFKNVG